jgi:hypothetical protein
MTVLPDRVRAFLDEALAGVGREIIAVEVDRVGPANYLDP